VLNHDEMLRKSGLDQYIGIVTSGLRSTFRA
jgi:hypothetical protein